MATSHHDREEETLIAYFQQMLAEVDDQEFNGEIQAQGSLQSVKPVESSYSEQSNKAVLQSANAAIESVHEASHSEESVENPFGGMAHMTTTDMLTNEMSMADDVEVVDNSLETHAYHAYETQAHEHPHTQNTAYDYSERQVAVELQHPTEISRELEPQVQLQEQTQSKTETKTYVVEEDKSGLQRLLSTIDTSDATAQSQLALATKIAQATAVQEPVVETQTQVAPPVVEVAHKEIVVAPAPVVETAVEVTPPVVEVQTQVETEVATEVVQVENVYKTPAQIAQENMGKKVRGIANEWKNVDLGEQFQALFFLVQGVRFAVPLIDLGGIFECDKITQLFGKPDWFMGITDVRGTKINIVDTLRWVMPEVGESPDKYPYLIALGTSHWSIGCDVLEGNRSLSSTQVKWREIPGSRPWLAGIVTSDKCALLHVNALISLFDAGAGIEDLVRDLEETKK